MTQIQLLELQQLLDTGNEHSFYDWTEWRRLRRTVLELDHYECQLCKAEGRYSRARIVHHVKHLRDRPDLALDIYDPKTGERQLVSVCKRHHQQEHPESLKIAETLEKPFDLPERWD